LDTWFFRYASGHTYGYTANRHTLIALLCNPPGDEVGLIKKGKEDLRKANANAILDWKGKHEL